MVSNRDLPNTGWAKFVRKCWRERNLSKKTQGIYNFNSEHIWEDNDDDADDDVDNDFDYENDNDNDDYNNDWMTMIMMMIIMRMIWWGIGSWDKSI